MTESNQSQTGREPSKNFRELIVWQKAHESVLKVYTLTTKFPKQETYGLTQQLRRASVSVPANIAEGYRRRGNADKVRFMNIAEASLEEARYYLILAKDLGYADTDELMTKMDEVCRLLSRYSSAIQGRDSNT